MPWTLLAVVDGFEYWTNADGFDTAYADVYRRKAANLAFAIGGEPMGLRWESKRWHYERYIAPKV